MSEAVTKWHVAGAVRAAALALLAREQTVAEVVASLADAVAADIASDTPAITPRESVAALRQSRRRAMLAEMERWEQRGLGSSAATRVAQKFATDPDDPVDVESLATKLRRWRRAERRTVSVSSPNDVG